MTIHCCAIAHVTGPLNAMRIPTGGSQVTMPCILFNVGDWYASCDGSAAERVTTDVPRRKLVGYLSID